MKKYLINLFIKLLLFITLLLDFSSCSNSSNSVLFGNVRISLVSPYNDMVEAKVYIEGDDGNIINGAVVSIKDSSNTVSILDYNYQQACYYKLIEKPSTDEYTITVNSNLFESPKIYTIPHIFLKDSIDYNSIEMVNQIGQSFQKYDSFITTYPIRITWSSVIENCTYKITIKTPLKTLYESTTNNKTIELPANIIPAGTTYVYLQIQQQKSYGDVLYENANYFSVSVYSTSNITFNVQ